MSEEHLTPDYIINLGEDSHAVSFEMYDPKTIENKRARLLKYCKGMLELQDGDCKDIEALDWLINNMSDKGIMNVSESLDSGSEEAVIETVKAAREDNLQNMETYEINGNKFVYEKGTLDPNAFRDRLDEIGQRIKGNSWMIYVDDNGELVIY